MTINNYSYTFKRADLAGYTTAIVVFLPFLGALLGRNFEYLGSGGAFSNTGKNTMALIAAALAFLFIGINIKSVIRVPSPQTRNVHNSIYLFFSGFLLSLAVGIWRGNPLGDIASSSFRILFPILNFYLGILIAKETQGPKQFISIFSTIGIIIIIIEILTSAVQGSLLYIRWGSGLAIQVFPFAFVAATIFKRKLLFPIAILLLLVYAIASNSRAQIILSLILVLFAVHLKHSYLNFPASSFHKRLKSYFLIVFLFAITPVLISSLGIQWSEENKGATEGSLNRLSGTVSDWNAMSGARRIEDLHGILDMSTWVRLIEAQSALTSQDSILFGNGLGANYYNQRVLYVPYEEDSNHYIHITPVLIFFRQGLIGIIVWCILLTTIVIIIKRGIRTSQDKWVRLYSVTAILFSLNCMLSFLTASGSFFMSFGTLMLSVGLISGRMTTIRYYKKIMALKYKFIIQPNSQLNTDS